MNESQPKISRFFGSSVSESCISDLNALLRTVLISAETRNIFLLYIESKNYGFSHGIPCSL